MRAWPLLLLLTACDNKGDETPDTETEADADADADTDTDTDTDIGVACGADAWGVVQLETGDGVTLEADWKPGPTAGSGAVVLLHMIPPGNDRSGYPERVRDAFAEVGVGVLNVDRRGAGGSGGVAADAYTGPGGLYDVEAAVSFVLSAESGCAADPARLVLVGASNGTTSVYDYTVGHDASLPAPAASIWMSPGTYTESQNALPTDPASWSTDLGSPLLWLYPTNEPYSTAYIADAPDAWRFVEAGTQHGTRMFDGGTLEDQTVAEMVAWITAAQGR